jgi:YVTN family beta-propeller protein
LLAVVPQNPKPDAPAAPPAATKTAAEATTWKVLRTFAVGGEGGWDYVAIDSEARRLYVPRATRVLVLDADTGKQTGEIADTAGVHGVALAPQLGRGFTSNGRADTCTVFNLEDGKVQKTIATGKNPDALTFEPTTKCIYIGNGRSHDVTVIAADKLEVLATIPLGGKPEAIVVDGKGKVFVNVEDKSEVVRIDASKNAVEQHLPLAPGTEPAGLAIDAEHHLLFATCSNEKMVVLDAETGKVLASPAIGKRTDGAAFDVVSGCAFSANGEGTLSVVATRGDQPFTVVQTPPTAPGARTLVLDPKSRQIYLPTADFETGPADASAGRRSRRIKADSFRIVVVGLETH